MTVEYDIYEPEEDSYLLSKYVKQFTSKDDNVLEIGIGSGIQCESALNKIKERSGNGIVVGLDINPRAVKHCKSSEYTKTGFFYESNLFETLKNKTFDIKTKKLKNIEPKNHENKFDIIIFNPPYLPDANDAEEIKYITTGGKHGYEIIDDFMKDASRFLTPHGKILMVFSSFTKKNKVDEIIEKYLFKYDLLEEQSIFFEKLYCYKVEKTDLLKELENNNIESISYLSKGKRGVVYQGMINIENIMKKCVIKVQSKNTTALDVIRKEAVWTKKVNGLGIGPEYYVSKYDINDKIQFVAREFIEGDLILDWVENNKENKDILKDVLIDILKQCYVLDQNLLEKKEMTKPLKHIIIRKVENNGKIKFQPFQIDFERMKNTERPSNVSQYLQFLSSGHLNPYINISRKETTRLSKIYIDKKDIKDIINYLNQQIN